MGDVANAKKGILLETGTNEFEIVEFRVGSVSYGINVAKVREVINLVPITKMPNSHHYVEGVFTLRGRLMPLVKLARCLGDDAESQAPKNIIVSELNNYFVGFSVDEVSRIHRVSWSMMEEAPNITNSNLVVGVIKMEQRIVIILDFEKIVAEINPEINIKLTAVPQGNVSINEQRKTKKIMIAEDSAMLRDLLIASLEGAGYTNLTTYKNGKEAWDALIALANTGVPIEDNVNILITDIEMPQMDGHNLIKRIREHRDLNKVPIIIFSSLINEEMRRKGEKIGANGQVSKPEMAKLVALVDSESL